ncbi:hypothetical protein [Desulfovibrio sp. JC022]|uniref:hypothetical protein n=1 Tax=Desulfovibrio sp. JC022 TaxID=2593642 RepID=UPI00193F1C6A|nr:hypothetical protein [Desulfovibrio sp. JC022]
MNDNLRFDFHKLHPRRVAEWLEGKNISPLHMEVCPRWACNHRFRFCSYNFMNYVPKYLNLEIFRERIPGIVTTAA